MMVIQAINILKMKVETKEERYALAFLLHELDIQFCYGWGAATSKTALTIFNEFCSDTKYSDEKNMDLGEIAMLVAGSPELGPWRLADFPDFSEYSQWFEDGQAKELSDIPF